MVKSHRRGGQRPEYHALSFGGWHDYQEWADNDFVPRPADLAEDDEPEPEPESTDTAKADDDADFDSEFDGALDGDYEWPPDSRPEPEGSPWREDQGERERGTMARPYVRTGGRARSAHDLRLETMISTTKYGRTRCRDTSVSADHRLIGRICKEPTSVAEIAAHIHAPLGVARVLISDAINSRLLTVHQAAPITNGRPPIELMRRVYDALCRLD